MSGKIAGRCWDLDIPQNEMHILQAMADHADHLGNNIYPSIGLIAWKAGCDERTAQRLISKLLDRGLLVEQSPANGRGHPAIYAIRVEVGPFKEPYDPRKKKGDKLSTFSKKKGDGLSTFSTTKGDKLSSERVTESTEKGDKKREKGDTAVSPKPLNVKEPSTEPKEPTTEPSTGTAVGVAGDDPRLGELTALGLTNKQAIDALRLNRSIDETAIRAYKACLARSSRKKPITELLEYLEAGRVPPLPAPPPEPSTASSPETETTTGLTDAKLRSYQANMPAWMRDVSV